MPVAEIYDFDHRIVMRKERLARIQLGNAAAEDRLLVSSHIEDFPSELSAGDAPAHNRDDPALACAAIAHLADRIQINVKIGDMPQGRFG